MSSNRKIFWLIVVASFLLFICDIVIYKVYQNRTHVLTLITLYDEQQNPTFLMKTMGREIDGIKT